ncbi:acyl-CoA thioesterase [Anaerocolumna xylanovorans]|uniref:Acyl-CoA thioester hydrolase n=1 Tax=Anaerocolumna xylanovorans DSM 12503 TaxID=1121345 RepID=A0A1M7XWN2_9FIRM|nr:thioesterase family protein [Anaerocolumna xylanovorans]SHO43181.1 acyl-CoA thioester hydrolase [Anaerocolumna xylanovorans DSM 12503]
MDIKPYVRKTHYYETDQMGIIHHANYIHWMEEARVDFMEQIGFGYERAVKEGIDFALLGISCEYKSMVCFGDTVNIQVSLTSLTVTKMTVQYEITDALTGKLRTRGESIHCYFDSNRKRPVSLKKVLPELYDLFTSLSVK